MKDFQLSYYVDNRYVMKFVKAASIAEAKAKVPSGAKKIKVKPAKSTVAAARFD